MITHCVSHTQKTLETPWDTKHGRGGGGIAFGTPDQEGGENKRNKLTSEESNSHLELVCFNVCVDSAVQQQSIRYIYISFLNRIINHWRWTAGPSFFGTLPPTINSTSHKTGVRKNSAVVLIENLPLCARSSRSLQCASDWLALQVCL